MRKTIKKAIDIYWIKVSLKWWATLQDIKISSKNKKENTKNAITSQKNPYYSWCPIHPWYSTQFKFNYTAFVTIKFDSRLITKNLNLIHKSKKWQEKLPFNSKKQKRGGAGKDEEDEDFYKLCAIFPGHSVCYVEKWA